MSVSSAHHSGDGKGFFGSLFDFSFKHFITLKFIKVIYALLVGLIGLSTVVFLIAALSRGGAGIVLGLVIVPAIGLVYLVMARIGMELVAVLFRIGENTSALAAYSALQRPEVQIAGLPPNPTMPPP